MDNLKEKILTYADLEEFVGNKILCNLIIDTNIEIISGNPKKDIEIFQFYLIENPKFLMDYTNELIYYNNELDLYIWAITHYGTSWDNVEFNNFS